MIFWKNYNLFYCFEFSSFDFWDAWCLIFYLRSFNVWSSIFDGCCLIFHSLVFETSNVWRLMFVSIFQCLIFDLSIFDLWWVLFDFWRLMFDLWYWKCVMFDVLHSIFDDWFLTIDVWWTICDVWSVMFDLRYLMSELSVMLDVRLMIFDVFY